MSPREKAQNEIAEFLREHRDYFTAPYGVLTGMTALRRGGKARNITFGVARSLDASILILSPTRIRVSGQGGSAYLFKGDFGSVSELIEHFEEAIKGR